MKMAMRSLVAALTATLAVAVAAAPGSSKEPTMMRLPAADAGESVDADTKLARMFAISDEGDLKLIPQNALLRGDTRFAGDFGDGVSDAWYRASADKAREDLRLLQAIDRAGLSAENKIAYDVFDYQTRFAIRGYDEGIVDVTRHLPIDQLFGQHVTYPVTSNGTGFLPFNTLADYEAGLARFDGFVAYLNNAQAQMRAGLKAGHVHPRFVAEKVIEQLDAAIKDGVDGSPFLQPVEHFPKDISAADAKRLRAAYRKAVAERVLPAFKQLRAFMHDTYLPAGRVDKPGLVGMKDGAAVYAYLIELHTTTHMSADEIHQIGLREVARILAEMDKIKDEVGFKGTLKAFFDYQRTDPKFKFKSEDALLDGYRSIWARLEPRLPELFKVMPKGKFEIRAVPAELAPTASGAYYILGTPDGSRPGVFYANTWQLNTRTSPRMETLLLHEAVPGHHWQGSLAQENDKLPAFLRFGGNTAYIEGWALYAESLGPELGLFTDPYQRFGSLDTEMLRAMRLVVDTGLHAKGWSREQAVKYMLDHSSLAENDVRADVDRYLVWAGQALAYKLGQLTIRRLRTQAEQALGDRFDVRDFHDQVLNSGPLPMAVLEAKIDAWVAATQAAHVKG